MSSPRYHSYLIRFWQASEAEPQDWRVSIEDPRTGEQRYFPNLQAAFSFFYETLQSTSAPAEQPLSFLPGASK